MLGPPGRRTWRASSETPASPPTAASGERDMEKSVPRPGRSNTPT
jgi:hypothetical protein